MWLHWKHFTSPYVTPSAVYEKLCVTDPLIVSVKVQVVDVLNVAVPTADPLRSTVTDWVPSSTAFTVPRISGVVSAVVVPAPIAVVPLNAPLIEAVRVVAS